MNSIAFIDTEIEPRSEQILDIGGVKDDGSCFHNPSLDAFVRFLNGTQFICGHNIFHHDIKYIRWGGIVWCGNKPGKCYRHLIFLSFAFSDETISCVIKSDKLQSEDTNNPLNDSIKAKDLFMMKLLLLKNGMKHLSKFSICCWMVKKSSILFWFYFIYKCRYRSWKVNSSKI